MKTTLTNWLKEEKLKAHRTSKEEIAQLFKIVDRDLADAEICGLSADRRFITAYNAALQLTTIVLRAYGLRSNPNKTGHHRISIDAVSEILGKEFQDFSDYLNACRIKRHVCDYTSCGEVSDAEAAEIIKETNGFKTLVLKWLKNTYPQFF